ncbi:reverse transcriptase domain-containing protein [Citrus sinensis]|nr:reverse transcriptase domain-containing protein [Citrus sinensis]
MSQEEILWLQKSRKDWLLHGDRNTNFFHKKTIARRRRNRIEAIRDSSGNWLYDEEDIKRFIDDIFTTGKVPQEITTTLLVLIPKEEHPTSLKMFRPISLCTMAYKTVTKIIATRLQSLLPNLIGPNQTSFVPRRHIVDNIVVAQEVVHSMRRKTGRKGFMAIKVDLEKAYDRLNWDFIFDTLQQTGIPTHLSRLIMECVTSASMSILWNGEVTGTFTPGRGIRQGDPLSPYLFVLCIERLSHGITHAVMDERWRPIRLAKYGTPLTHLFFADDLLLFAEASIDQAYVVDAVLENYCRSSEAKINKLKTKVFFSKNVDTRDANLIGSTLDFSATNNLGDYLGMPLIHTRPIPQELINATVSEFTNGQGGWNWSSFEHLLPHYTFMQIASVMPPRPHFGFDKIYWGLDPSGMFTVRSAYASLCYHHLADHDRIWKLPWSWKGPQSIRLFLWQLMHGKLKTHVELARRHINVPEGCDRCGGAVEDILHALRDCCCINQVWRKLVPMATHNAFFNSNLREWIAGNLQNKWKIASSLPWDCIFGVVVWRLWFWRNHFLFAGKLVDGVTVYMDAMARANEIYKVYNSGISQQPRRKEIFIRWIPPPWPWCKLNSDGSRKNDGEAGAGGVIRDSVGHWISGFCMRIGESSVLMAELWGLYQGLILA